jgi:CBS domain-containing protein
MTTLSHPEDFYIRVLLQKVKIKEIMASPVISIEEHSPFCKVEEAFRQKEIRHLPVVDVDNKIVGLITQRDFFRIVSPRKLMDSEAWYYDKETLDGIILKNVMIKNPFVLSGEHTAADAILEMVRRKYGCIPIVDKDKILCGIITQVDLLKIAAQILTEGRKT